jgi:predicted RNase H-like nuclease
VIPTAIDIDLAWSPRNATGLAVATVRDSEVLVLATTTATTTADILDFIRPHVAAPLTVAIDAPTIVPHENQMRECERQLHRDATIRAAHAAPYPGTRKLLGACNGGVPRGEQLVRLLRVEFGIEEVGFPPTSHSSAFAMEVFPAAAMVRLFTLTVPLVYKKKRGRSWDVCRVGLNSYIDQLRNLDRPSLVFPADLRIGIESGRRSRTSRIGWMRFCVPTWLRWHGSAEPNASALSRTATSSSLPPPPLQLFLDEQFLGNWRARL